MIDEVYEKAVKRLDEAVTTNDVNIVTLWTNVVREINFISAHKELVPMHNITDEQAKLIAAYDAATNNARITKEPCTMPVDAEGTITVTVGV